MKMIPALALSLAGAAAGPAAAQDVDPVAELARICAETRCHAPGTIRVNLEDGSIAEFEARHAWPIVHDGFVAIFPGATLFLAGEIVDGKLVNLRAVDEPAAPAGVLKLRMYQEEGKADTFLHLTNYFPEFIKFRAAMMLPMEEALRVTSSCPVMSDGRHSYEHWPHPVFQLLLSEFLVVAGDGEIVCE